MIWFLGSAACLVCTGFIVRSILQPQTIDISAASKDLALYKDQLREVDSDLARGVLSETESESARLEISRRILAADKRAQMETLANPAPSIVNKLLAAFVILTVLTGSLGIYANLGEPNLPDRPLVARLAAAQEARAQRLSQEDAEVQVPDEKINIPEDYLKLVKRLREAIKKRPNDEQGLRLLALHEFRIGKYRAARKAHTRIMKVVGDKVTAKDYIDFAEVMIFATNGYVSPEAEITLSQALKLKPNDGRTRYYSGLAMAQNGRADVAYRLWEGLLKEGPQDAAWIPLIKSQIDDVARLAGINMSNQPLPGPTTDQINAASEMTKEDRKKMIRGMVAGLGERLATNGGTMNEWARLIRALGVLGETARASEIWNEAKDVFSDNPKALNLLLEAAQAAEISQ
ncbi:MAG: c-type cytochrome biogenesis protein CcmI [Amylibacter sp.]|nr:c-type cytochrome biogenesis protein CcmI [Amylibacter sp.]